MPDDNDDEGGGEEMRCRCEQRWEGASGQADEAVDKRRGGRVGRVTRCHVIHRWWAAVPLSAVPNREETCVSRLLHVYSTKPKKQNWSPVITTY